MGQQVNEIVVLGKYYSPFQGGIESNTTDVCEFLAGGNHVTAIVFNHVRGKTTVENINHVQVVRCRVLATWASQPISLAMFWHILRTDGDVIHFHAPNFVANAALWLKQVIFRNRTPVVITHHMDVFGRATMRAAVMWMYRGIVARARAVIVTSLKNAAISKDLPPNSPIIAVPLGLDLKTYEIGEEVRTEASAWRAELAGQAPLVGFLGRHARYKGLDVLMRALQKLDGVHAAIAGDGPYRKPTEDLAKTLGIKDRVHFLGMITHREKLRMLSAIDVFAFPSTEITEAFGVSQVEAMAVGAPVVATDLPTGVTDVAQSGQTALVVAPGHPDELADAIRTLIQDRALAARLAVSARGFVESNLAKEVVTARAAAVIEGTMG